MINEQSRRYSFDCDDVAALDPLDEASLVGLIGARYEEAPLGRPPRHERIYTRAGPIIVAINPLCPVPTLYTESQRRKYHKAALARVKQEKDGSSDVAEELEALPPHIYEVSGTAYHRMCDGRSQAVVINGESGAGKTGELKPSQWLKCMPGSATRRLPCSWCCASHCPQKRPSGSSNT